MTRTRWMGGVVVCAMTLVGASVSSAQEAASRLCSTCPVGARSSADKPQTRKSEAAGITFTMSVSSGKAVIRAEGHGVVFDKTADASGTNLRVRSGGDSIGVKTRADGSVELVRKGQSVTVRANNVLADVEGRVRKLTQESEALKGLTRLAVAIEQVKVNRPETVAVLTSLAVVHALQGDALGNQLLARRLVRPDTVGIVQVAQRTREGDTVADCWAAYERFIARNYARYGDCLLEYWWNQPMQRICGLEWAINAELAWFQLIACSGGIPITG